MNWFTAFVLFVMIWWTTLFAVLPFWTRPVSDPARSTGGWRGAPEEPHLFRKALVTTLIATLVWGVAMAVIASDYFSFRSGWLYMQDN